MSPVHKVYAFFQMGYLVHVSYVLFVYIWSNTCSIGLVTNCRSSEEFKSFIINGALGALLCVTVCDFCMPRRAI